MLEYWQGSGSIHKKNQKVIKPLIMTVTPLAAVVGGGFTLMNTGVTPAVAFAGASLLAVFTVGVEAAYCIISNKVKENKTYTLNKQK